MEKNIQTRRDFLRNTLKLGAGVAAMTALSPVMGAVAEEAKQKDYEWVPNAAPCQLIEEIEAAGEGLRTFKFTTDGRVCSKSVTFSLTAEDVLTGVYYDGGCDGGTQGIAVMAEGRPAAEIVEILLPIVCGLKKSGSSCAMQLAMAIKQAQARIKGTGCPGCEGTTCVNA